jgi:hypothetical protein
MIERRSPMRRLVELLASALVVAVTAGAPAFAQTFNSGSTGADGAFNPTSDVTLTLPPGGVFNFTTIDIPGGVTVRFKRNATNTPVTLLANGDVKIQGRIDVSGADGGPELVNLTLLSSNGGAGGPGGFDGGGGSDGVVSTAGGSGLGPGGGAGGAFPEGGVVHGGSGGGFARPGAASGGGEPGGTAYGVPTLLPLIGGSGGGGGGSALPHTGAGGGGGGGALLIASSGTITFNGVVRALGGFGGSLASCRVGAGGGGTGGAVRLVATAIAGAGTIDVSGGGPGGACSGETSGGAGSAGRVRLEAFTNTAGINFPGGARLSSASPGPVTLANAPTLRITSVGGVAAPASPGASLSNPDIVLPDTVTNPVTINLAASNIPLGTTVAVTVSGRTGGSASVASTGLAGTVAASTASASVTLPFDQPSVIGASASFSLIVAGSGGPVFVDGEEVDRVRVSATLGDDSRLIYITKSGREVLLSTR